MDLKPKNARNEDDPLYLPNPNLNCLLCRMMWECWKLCLNSSDTEPTLFEFPDDPVTFKAWCRNIRTIFVVKEKMYKQRICSLHFKAKDFTEEKTLKVTAVPVVHDYNYYFKGERTPRKVTACEVDTCFLCYMLKNWKINCNLKKAPVKLFQIPEKGDAWRLAIRQVYTNKEVHDETKICGMHFKDTDFVDKAREHLKEDAVPIVHKYSHYFPIKDARGTPVEVECLLCMCLSKWKVVLKPAVRAKLFPMPIDGSAWKAAIKAVHMDKVVDDEAVICSLHFRESDFTDQTHQELKPDAVPIVNKYSFYFKIPVPKREIRIMCFVCSLLKYWNVELTNPTNSVIKQFAFPKEEKTWLAVIRRHHPTARPGNQTMICSLHFRSSDFIDDTCQVLKPTAVPIILPRSFYSSMRAVKAPAKINKPKSKSPPKRKATPTRELPMKLVKGDKSKSGSDAEDYIEIDWMKF